jgi:hypothetical protein
MEAPSSAELKKLWEQANAPKVSLEDREMLNAINNFWEYVQHHVGSINIKELKTKDIPLIDSRKGEDWRDYHMLLSPSGVVYMAMSTMFEKICVRAGVQSTDKPRLNFILEVNQFPLKLHEQAKKFDGNNILKRLVNKNFAKAGIILNQRNLEESELWFERYFIVITCSGKLEYEPLLQKIYEISRKYTLPDDWQVVKYLPPVFRADDPAAPPLVIPLSDTRIALPGSLKYHYGDKKLIICTAEPITQEENRLANLMVVNLLMTLFGEYAFMHHIRGVGVVSETVFARTRPIGAAQLKPAAGFFPEFQIIVFEGTRACQFCNLRDCNTEFKTINHDLFNEGKEDCLPEGDYCTYCIQAMDRLFLH